MERGVHGRGKGALWKSGTLGLNLHFSDILNRVCHGSRLTKQDDYFGVTFDHTLRESIIFEAVVKIGSSLKLNHQKPN